MMYRTHCQRMLDTIISANFEGVGTPGCMFYCDGEAQAEYETMWLGTVL